MLDPNRRRKVRLKWKAKAAHSARTFKPMSAHTSLGFVTPERGLREILTNKGIFCNI